MRGALPLAFFIMILAGGLLLLAPWQSSPSDNSATSTSQGPLTGCFLVVYTIVDDSADYGRITGVNTQTSLASSLAASSNPGAPYITVTLRSIANNATLYSTTEKVGDGSTTTYINVTDYKGQTVYVDVKLYDQDTGSFGIPQTKLLDSYSSKITLCG